MLHLAVDDDAGSDLPMDLSVKSRHHHQHHHPALLHHHHHHQFAHHLHHHHQSLGRRTSTDSTGVGEDEAAAERDDRDRDLPLDLGRRSVGAVTGGSVTPGGQPGAGSGSILYNELANPYTLFSYYYLMNQAGPLSARASVAAAMADAYSKLTERMVNSQSYQPGGTGGGATVGTVGGPMSGSGGGISLRDKFDLRDHMRDQHHHHRELRSPIDHYHPTAVLIKAGDGLGHHHHHGHPVRISSTKSGFDTSSSSPTSSVDGGAVGVAGKTELRSADTTALLLDTVSGHLAGAGGERKRISRPLTGRHVRHGTGASPSTLLVLRKLLKERQRLRELGLPLPSAKKTRKQAKRKC